MRCLVSKLLFRHDNALARLTWNGARCRRLSFKGQFPSRVMRWWCQKVRCRAGTYFGTLCRTLTDSSGLPEQAEKTLTTTRHNTKGPASQGVVFLALTQFGHQGNARFPSLRSLSLGGVRVRGVHRARIRFGNVAWASHQSHSAPKPPPGK